MINYKFSTVFVSLLLFAGSLAAVESPLHEYDFTKGHQGWVADFADYPVGEEAFYELTWGWENQGLFLSGNNHSDDLFMFIKKKVENLTPNTEYWVTFDVIIETNIPAGMFGVGGSPGESVIVKAGAASVEPEKVDTGGYYRMNVDKGEQGEGGEHVVIIGDLANEAVDVDNPQYSAKELDNLQQPLKAKTDAQGNLWLLFGTDSGFEATTKYYITKITVNIL